MSFSLKSTVGLAAVALLAAGSAEAHAKLLSATPSVGGQVKQSPVELRIAFSEGIVPKFSGAALADAAGHAVPTGDAATAPGDRKTMTVPIKAKLARGVYTVTWRAVAADTHRSQGHYSFTVD